MPLPSNGEIMRSLEFVSGEYYHVYDRRVDRRNLFDSTNDYRRFYESMYLFNDAKYSHVRGDDLEKYALLAGHEVFAEDRDPFVKIFSFILMPNHFHLFVQQLSDNGLSRFMHKLKKGYSRYYNIKNERTGALFEGQFKAKHINAQEYLEHLPIYIHLNALDLSGLPWREGLIKSWPIAEAFLEQYPHSSHQSYVSGEQPYPLIDLDFYQSIFSTKEDYLQALSSWSSRDLCREFDAVTE